MGRWDWLKRSESPENPATSLSDPASWLWAALGARNATSGVSVTPENALEVSAVWAAVRMISSTVATLPLHVYRRTASGKEKAIDLPAYRLLHDAPNSEQSAFTFRETMLGHLLTFGNFYAEVERSNAGEVLALWPIYPTLVTIRRVGGQLVYGVRVDGQEIPLAADQMLHIKGLSLDGLLGLQPVSLARNTIGLAKATEIYGSSFFSNSGTPAGIITHPGKITKAQQDALLASWAARHSGLSNAQRVGILEQGMTWSPLSNTNEANQYLETRRFSVTEVARVFGIPPHLIGDLERSTFSNIEAQGIEFVRYCIEPWCRRVEAELNRQVLDGQDVFASFVLEGLLRGDSKARAEFYTAMLDRGVLSINEVRELENFGNIGPDGDKRMVPLNFQSLNQLGQKENA